MSNDRPNGKPEGDLSACDAQAGGEPADHGLVCRGCGCRHFHVIYTRRTSKNRILRRRECRHCGRRITTYEEQIGGR